MKQRPDTKHVLLCGLLLSSACSSDGHDADDGGGPGTRADGSVVGTGDSSAADSEGGASDAGHADAASDCSCTRGGNLPVCGVDGKNYDAICGRDCVPVQIKCDGQCPCPVAGTTRWYLSCGAPVCDSDPAPYDSPSIPNCAPNLEGKSCDSAGAVCDGVAGCGATLVCAKSDPRLASCPVSRARYKEDIAYLSDLELRAHHERIVSMPLATYHYRGAPELGPQLGFIIEDIEPSEAANGGRVNLYGYLSMAVAAIKVQQAQIESLQREVGELRAQEHNLQRADGSRTRAARSR